MPRENIKLHGGRVHVFIDASNLWSVQKSMGRSLDYSKLLVAFGSIFNTSDIKVYYYAAFPADGTREYSLDKLHSFFTFLAKGLKFIVRKKPLKQISVGSGATGTIQEKGNMDVEMTIDAVHLHDKYDTAVLMTGDSDFLALVSYLKSKGKKVFIFSSKNNVSRELRTGGSGYFDLLLLEEDIWRNELRHRKQLV